MSSGHYPTCEASALLIVPPWRFSVHQNKLSKAGGMRGIEIDRAMKNWGALKNSQIVDG